MSTKDSNGKMISLTDLSLAELVNEYNECAEQLMVATITRFSDHTTGLRRTEAILDRFWKNTVGAQTSDENNQKSQKNRSMAVMTLSERSAEYDRQSGKLDKPEATQSVSEAESAQPSEEKKPNGRGRISPFRGKTLTATVAENPRLNGSHGWYSLNIIIQNPGISYASFLVRGGRSKDLAWDVARDRVAVS